MKKELKKELVNTHVFIPYDIAKNLNLSSLYIHELPNISFKIDDISVKPEKYETDKEI